MFVTGPNVVKTVTHEEVDSEYLGGAETHTTISGVAHLAAADEATAMDHVRRLLAHLPQNNLGEPPRIASHDPVDRRDPELDHVVPDDSQKPYNMHDVIRHVVDDGDFFEIQPGWAPNILIGFARLVGRSVGIVAQQPAVRTKRAGHRRVDQGRALRADLRPLQRPARHVRRRSGFPARRWPGAWRHHQAWRKAALRLLRGDRPEVDGDHAEGLRGRLRRHEQQAHPRLHELRMANR